MRIKYTVVVLMVLLLGACSLAKDIDDPSSDQPWYEEDNFVGVFVVARADFFDTIPDFDVANNDLTFFIVDEVENDEGTYTTSLSSGVFYDSSYHVHLEDDKTTQTFNGVIPVLSTKEAIITVFEVLKDENGNYVLGGTITSIGINGYSAQNTFERETKTTIDDKEVINALKIEIKYEVFDPLEQIKIVQMNKQYNIINQHTIEDNLELDLDENTTFIIIEETRIDKDGNKYYDITSYGLNDVDYFNQILHTFIESDDQPLGQPRRLALRVSP
jgi:hypothetical protein